MLDDDFLGTEKSQRELEAKALSLRALFGIENEVKVDLRWLLEAQVPELFPQFALIPKLRVDLPHNLAVTGYEPPRIEVRDEVYAALSRDHPTARYVVAHEFSHLVLHRGLPKSLKDGAQERKLFSATLKRMSVEQQADDMTLFFLAPREIVEAMKSLAEVVNRCSVPYKLAAKARDRYAIRHFRKLEPYEVADLLIPEEEPFEEA